MNCIKWKSNDQCCQHQLLWIFFAFICYLNILCMFIRKWLKITCIMKKCIKVLITFNLYESKHVTWNSIYTSKFNKCGSQSNYNRKLQAAQIISSYRIYHCVVWQKFTNVLMEHKASVFRVKEKAEYTKQATTIASLLAWLTLQPCRWRQYVPPKCQQNSTRTRGNTW
jgi:hypothetical protein